LQQSVVEKGNNLMLTKLTPVTRVSDMQCEV